MAKTKILIRLFTFLILNSAFLILNSPVSAQAGPQAWGGVCVGGSNNDVATILGVQCLIANIFSVAITIIGLAGFVMMIYGSFLYLLSGDISKADKAKKTLTYAVIGLVVALSAFIILNLIASFTGVNILRTFNLSAP